MPALFVVASLPGSMWVGVVGVIGVVGVVRVVKCGQRDQCGQGGWGSQDGHTISGTLFCAK